MSSFVSRTVLSSSCCVGSVFGFFLRGDDGSRPPDTVLALSDALELLGYDDVGVEGGEEENDDDDANVNKKHRAPVVLCRRRVHGCVLAVAKLPIKVRDTSMELRK